MGEKLIKPYEISVWEDKLVKIENTDPAEYRFEENKIAVIGSDTMTGMNRIYNPIFNKKSNGEKSLTFSLKYKYFDPYTENEEIINPFAALLVNERKIKLKYDGKWYEFIVKDHSESSENYEWTYTCTDAFVLELSKTGYNITFDAELNNNQGTAQELTEETLKDTDWRVGVIDPGKQYIAEPIYQGVLKNYSGLTIINVDNNGDEIPSINSDIYVFYSYIKNQSGKFVQFIIHDEERKYVIDSKNIITDTNFRIINELVYRENQYIEVENPAGNPEEQGWYENNNGEYVLTHNIIIVTGKTYYKKINGFYYKNGNNYNLIIELNGAETRYQANRLAYNQRTTYDPVMERTVDRFEIGDREIYKYSDSVYSTSEVLVNYITNGDNFNELEDGSLQGWNPYVGPYIDNIANRDNYGKTINKLLLVTKPERLTNNLISYENLYEVEGYLKVQFSGSKTSDYKNLIYNSGFENNASLIQSVSKGEKYVFRWRAKKGDSVNSTVPAQGLRMIVAKYTSDAPAAYHYYFKHIDKDNIIFDFTLEPGDSLENHILNNRVKGGYIQNDTYYINGVAQTPSTKYIYEVEDNNTVSEYIWNNSHFVSKDDENYLPYYYLIAEAQKTIPNGVLADPTQKYGIFLYNTEGAVTYFIQEIQLTRFIADGEDETGQTPMLIGNVPIATTKLSDYYYLQPAINTPKEDVKTYATIEALKNDLGITGDVKPIYNDNSEKVLSISAAQSNCFNILQTISETFECWVDLDVRHDSETGYILKDSEGKLQKYINLREYIGNDNWAGFKYGINLQSIERQINSEEVVTKLIVEQTQSDYVEDGYVSITEANSNISGESYILNFDYYYGQNLLNREEVETDRLNFIDKIAKINKDLKDAETKRKDYMNSYVKLSSDRNTYTELIATAQDNLTNALANFQDLTSMEYSKYQEQQNNLVLYNEQYYVRSADTGYNESKTYYSFNGSVFTPVDFPDPETNPSPLGSGWYELYLDVNQVENLNNILGEIYINSAYINNYSGLLTNTNILYNEVKTKLYGADNYSIKIWYDRDAANDYHIYLEANDYSDNKFKFYIRGQEYKITVSKKFFDIIYRRSYETPTPIIIQFEAPAGYKINNRTNSYNYTINEDTTETIKIKNDNTTEGIVDVINELIEEKSQTIKDFNNKYSRFIQEGTWSSTEYIDSELYYLDALQISNTSAQPTISYTINVTEISQLEGFENYSFDAGDKSYIEDTEFFGWSKVNVGTEQEQNYVLTPAREEVIVSEVEWHLDEPDQNTISVQNYKTRFEDLFQRVNATVQTVQYNEATYAKISSLLDENGTINQDVLLESMNNLSGREYALTSNGSIIVQNDIILVRNLTNPANRVMINSEGIRVSSDGGDHWTTAIDGEGINIGVVYTGSLNTNEIIIGNKLKPSFRWDRYGISAYDSKSIVAKPEEYVLTEDETVVLNKIYYEYNDNEYIPILDPDETLNPHNEGWYEYIDEIIEGATNLQTFVRFDEYGLYGIKNGANFKAQSLEDVKNTAHFAVTWDGFFIKSSYKGGGRVSLTSENDFQVIKKFSQNNQLIEQEKIKIGALEWDYMISKDSAPIAGKTYYSFDENTNSFNEILNVPQDSNPNGQNFYEKLNAPTETPQNSTIPSKYGIRIKNDANETVMKTDDDGNLEITGILNAMGGNFKDLVTVGKDDSDNTKPYLNIDGRDIVNNTPQLPYIGTSDFYEGAGSGWKIDAAGDAVFNNITARGAIKTSVFEYAEIQAVGGIFIFRPSSKIKSAEPDSGNIIVTVDNPLLFKVNQWCKISNYTGTGHADDPDVDIDETYYKQTEDVEIVGGKEYYTYNSQDNIYELVEEPNIEDIGNYFEIDSNIILSNNGLVNVYRISNISSIAPYEITLEGAAAMIGESINNASDLIGGALVDMGNTNGNSNYGIGINSSDNTVNLPARAISLFETKVQSSTPPNEPKIIYDYKGILGTLPTMSSGIDINIYRHMQGTQGIYTNNMYIGDANQYLAFYTDEEDLDGQNIPKKKLKIKANQIIFENPRSETGWSNVDPTQGGHFIYNGIGAAIIQNDEEDPADWGYNTWITSGGIYLRHNEDSYAALNTNGLILNKGGIEAGELNENNFVYVSSEPYGENYSINNTESNDWKQIIGTRFGIRSDGTLYATGAHIAESIEAENLKIGQWTTFDHRLKLCEGTYNLSNDTEVQRGKVYFEQKVIDGVETYEMVTPDEGDNPHNKGWRELVQNVPSDWTDHRDQYFVASQYEDDYDNIDASVTNFGGNYYVTGDEEIDRNKIYYERTGSGTELDPFKYTVVEELTIEDNPHEEGWYELQKLFYEKDMDSPQMIIGNKKDFAVTVDNTQITFWYDHQKVAFINGDRMQIPRSVMLEEMLIGQKKWSWREHEGNLQLKWIGD